MDPACCLLLMGWVDAGLHKVDTCIPPPL
eukprot:COSAG06_NODE_45713_length_352_cov_1.581028_1_plen_28_part_10